MTKNVEKVRYIRRGIILKGRDYGSVLFDAKTGRQLKLNNWGTKVIQLGCEEYSPKQIATKIANGYGENPELVLKNVIKFFQALQNMEIITYDKKNSAKTRLREMHPPLDIVSLRLTNKCNLRCKHCFVSSGEVWRDELSTDEVKELIDQLAIFKLFNLTLTGGEPLLRDDFFEICAYCDQKEIPIEIFTNGTLMDDYIIKKIKKLQNLQAVGLSLNGISPNTHDFIHEAGNFQTIVALIQRLVHENIPVHVHTCLNKVNFLEYRKIINLALDLGASLIHMAPIFIEGRARKNRNKFELLPTQIAEAAHYCASFKNRVFFDTISCIHTCRNECMICPNGDVAPCRPLASMGIIAGNVRKTPFHEIWARSRIFRKLRTISVDKIKGCRKCIFKYECGGGCRASAYEYRGDFLGLQNPLECSWRKTYYKKLRAER